MVFGQSVELRGATKEALEVVVLVEFEDIQEGYDAELVISPLRPLVRGHVCEPLARLDGPCSGVDVHVEEDSQLSCAPSGAAGRAAAPALLR